MHHSRSAACRIREAQHCTRHVGWERRPCCCAYLTQCLHPTQTCGPDDTLLLCSSILTALLFRLGEGKHDGKAIS